MKPAIQRFKPAGGFSRLLHVLLVALLPILVFVLIRMHFVQPALAIILLSKWRMFAVRPRFWLANIRANAVDITVGVSVVLFMTQTAAIGWQLLWAILYGVWLIMLKPGTSVVMVSTQAMVGFLCGIVALFLAASGGALSVLVLMSGLISFLAARHFFDSFDEQYARFLSYIWAFITAALVWVLGHWLLFYGIVAQPALLLITLAYGLAGIYYFDHHDRLSKIIKTELVFVMSAIVIINVVALLISTRGSKII